MLIDNCICKITLSLALLTGSFLLTGCSSSYRAEPLELPVAALDCAIQNVAADSLIDPTGSLPPDWWSLFNDEQLNEYIETALARNPTLHQAQAKIVLAAYAADRVQASLFPSLNWGADVSRQKLSETALIPFDTNPTPGSAAVAVTPGKNQIPVYFTQYETELTLTYNFDIWGKTRNTLRAARGEVYANIADERFSRLQLGIAVARAYYQLQVDYKRQEIADALVKNQSEYLDLVERRMKGNLDTNLVVSTSKFNLASAKQAQIGILGDIALRENQLRAYLAGDFDEEIDRTNIVEQPLPKIPLPCDLPLHLIAYRPDITAQLWLIESAGKQIEVAKAGFYPDFNLTALFGYQTLHLHELFKWPSSNFNVDPAVSLPIFDGGRLIANLGTSEVNYDLAIFKYNELVLNAVREVLDGLASLRTSEQQLQEAQQLHHHQEEYYTLTKRRLEHSLGNGLEYLISEQNMLMARDQEIIALGNTLQALLSLIKALGGGYSCEVCEQG